MKHEKIYHDIPIINLKQNLPADEKHLFPVQYVTHILSFYLILVDSDAHCIQYLGRRLF